MRVTVDGPCHRLQEVQRVLGRLNKFIILTSDYMYDGDNECYSDVEPTDKSDSDVEPTDINTTKRQTDDDSKHSAYLTVQPNTEHYTTISLTIQFVTYLKLN